VPASAAAAAAGVATSNSDAGEFERHNIVA